MQGHVGHERGLSFACIILKIDYALVNSKFGYPSFYPLSGMRESPKCVGMHISLFFYACYYLIFCDN